jgi:hypothetical protein
VTFKVIERGRCVIVTKKVPIRNVPQTFMYAFEIGYSTTDEQIKDGVARAKKAIGKEIRRTLVEKGVTPPAPKAENRYGNHKTQ